MSTTPVEAPPNGDSDTFLIARNLLHLASAPWSPPTQESLEVALATYQAAMKLQSDPEGGRSATSLHRRLDLVTEEIRRTRQELRDTREETARTFLAMNARLDRLLGSASYGSDTATEDFEEGTPSRQDPTVTDSPRSGSTSINEDTAVPLSTPEDPRPLGASNSPKEPIHVPPSNATSQSQGLEVVATTTTGQASNTRWTPTSVGRPGRKPLLDESSLDFVEKKVKGLLNKLTSENFDSVSNQIVGLVNRSENERNCETLVLVLKLVFEKATDESNWAEMYARLCRKLMERISPNIHHEKMRDAAGEPVAGGHLFRKLLLNRCQENFERGWLQTETLPGGHSEDGQQPEMWSDEYYRLVKAKRQGLGLVRLIGELFKMQMLTARIMHECIKRLLPDTDSPNEADIESLCQLLSTVGEALDVPRFNDSMDMYFGRIRLVAESSNTTSRIRCLILDVIELRQRSWRPKGAESEPPTTRHASEQARRSNLFSVLGRRLSQPEAAHPQGGFSA